MSFELQLSQHHNLNKMPHSIFHNIRASLQICLWSKKSTGVRWSPFKVDPARFASVYAQNQGSNSNLINSITKGHKKKGKLLDPIEVISYIFQAEMFEIGYRLSITCNLKKMLQF